METIIDEERIKNLIKSALLEVLEERKEFLHELLAEVIAKRLGPSLELCIADLA